MSSEISGDLEFAALHADDLLLDALGARRPGGSAGDPIAGLLQAYVAELDARPGPLTALLTPADGIALPPRMPAVAEAELAPAPPVLLPVARRTRFLVAPRAAAVVTVGTLVLGIGGVSAAVTGDGGPLDGIRRVVGSVTEQVSPERSDADRVAKMLGDAEKALAADDLRGAREFLEAARSRLDAVEDPSTLSRLRGNLVELRDRWRAALDRRSASDRSDGSDKAGADRVTQTAPGSATRQPASPESEPRSLVPAPEGADPTDKLPAIGEKGGLHEAKERIAESAEQKLEPLPDLPFGEMRTPTWAPIVEEILGGR